MDSEIHDESNPCWSPDGKQIVFCSNRTEDPDLDWEAIDLFVIPAAGGDFRKIETPFGVKSDPIFSPDGKWIAYYSRAARGEYWRHTCLWITPADSKGEARNLTEAFNLNISSWTLSDMGIPPMAQPIWSNDGKTLYFQAVHRGNTKLKSVSLSGDLRSIIDDDGVVGTFNLDSAQSKVAYFHADIRDSGQIWVRNLPDGHSRQLTRFNQNLLGAIDLGEIDEVWFNGPTDNELQGWILKPPDFDASQKYPSITVVHIA